MADDDFGLTDEEIKRGKRMLRILDIAYLKITRSDGSMESWEDYLEQIRDVVLDDDDAIEMLAVMTLRDAGLLHIRGLSPSFSWSGYYKEYGDRLREIENEGG